MTLTSLRKKLARLSPAVRVDNRTRTHRSARLATVEPLEERRLLSITPDTSYRDLQDTTLVVGVEYGLLTGSTGQNLSATLVGQPAHGSIKVHKDGTFQYTPDPGFTGNDHFKFRDSPSDPQIQTAKIDVMTPDVWAKQPAPQPTTAGQGSVGVSPMNQVSDQGESLSDSDDSGQGGTPLHFTVSVAGVWPYTMVQTRVQDDTTTPLEDHQERAVEGYDYLQAGGGYTVLGTSATFTVDVDTHDNPGQTAGTTSKIFDFIATVPDQYQPWGDLEADALGTILVHDAKPCKCYCGCDPAAAPAKVDPPEGGLQLKTGPSNDAPGKAQLDQTAEPPPIISADDTLSATVASATSITAQLTLYDSSGNAVYTGDPIYYSTVGATAGEAVRFAQQIDAGSLATGAYQWSMDIAENYSSGAPVMRNYGGITTVHNLDNSPYGRGWMLANLDSLALQSDGVTLADGNGNLYFFLLDNWDPQSSYITPDGLAGRATLTQNPDGSYTITWNDGSLQQFNATGQLVTATDINGNSVSYTYTAGGALSTLTDSRGTTTFSYTSGMLTSVIDFAGRVTTYTYTGGRVTSVTLPDPGHNETTPSKTFAYDPVTGLVSSYTDATGTTSITYGLGRDVTRITHPDGTYETFNAPLTQPLVDTSSGLGGESDPATLVPVSTIIGTQTDENGHTSQFTVDANGNTLTEIDADGNETAYTYTATGLIASVTQPPLTPGAQNLVTMNFYDANNNLIEEDLPDGTKQTWTIDPTWNEPTVYIDPAGRETDYTLDAANGNVLTVTQVGTGGDSDRVAHLTYTPDPTMPGDAPAGLVATVVDPRGIETDYAYTSFGAISSIVYAVGT